MKRQRILVWGMSNNVAGTEMVINNYSSALPDLSFDFLCYSYPSNFSHLLDNGHNRFFTLPVKIENPIAYWRSLKKYAKSHFNEYSTLWFNINEVSNIDLLRMAANANIPRRIVHMHNGGMPSRTITQVFSKLNWSSCLTLATDKWACSKVAGDFLFGNDDYTVVPNMVDPQKVSFSPRKRAEIRSKYGMNDALVLGSIGRLENQKNYQFLIRVLRCLADRGANAMVLLVGEGSKRGEIESLAHSANVSDRLVFTGPQRDVQGFYSAFDIAVYPSLYEGLSLAIIEAQFNGLPCILSDTISPETIISEEVSSLSITDPIAWAEAASNLSRSNQQLIKPKAKCFDIKGIRARATELFSIGDNQ